MRTHLVKHALLMSAAFALFGCGEDAPGSASDTQNTGNGNNSNGEVIELVAQPIPATYPTATNGDMLLGNSNYPAISYGAWRSDVREDGVNVPSVDMQKEDMKILSAMGIKIIRTYNTQGYIDSIGNSNTENLLQAIDELKAEDSDFEMYVMLGVWIDALNSWTDLEIDPYSNNPENHDEIAKAKELALLYPDIVKVIAVGNEAMVEWAPYHVVPGIILDHVEDLQAWKLEDESTSDIWITSSDNHAVWAGNDANGNNGNQADLKELIETVDYISLHTYAMHDTYYNPTFEAIWQVPESQQAWDTEAKVDAAMERAYDHTIDQIKAAQVFINGVDATKPIHIGETGWTTSNDDWKFGETGTRAADEFKQKRFHDDMRAFTDEFGASLFFFQAFDEPWKGSTDATDPEKHFGLIDIDGNVKYVAWDTVQTLNDLGLSRGAVQSFTQSYMGDEVSLMNDVLPPKDAPIQSAPVEGEFQVLDEALYSGATAYGWDNPLTAWAGINTDTGILTIATDPSMAAIWGWGAGVGIAGNTSDLNNKTTMSFEIRGVVGGENNSVLADFPLWVGYQTEGGNHWVRFNDGSGYTISDQWTKYTIELSEFSSFGSANLSQVVSPFTIADIYSESGGSAPKRSDIEVRNISWFE